MITDFLNNENIKFDVEVVDANEAIIEAGLLLLKNKKILPNYIEEMLQVYRELGAYIVVAPGIAFPHSKPSPSVLEKGLSFVKLKKPIPFNHPQNDPVEFVFALCGINETDHLDMLQELSLFLMNEENLKMLKTVNNKGELLSLLEKGGDE